MDIIRYIESQFAPFAVSPFNTVDSLIFSKLSYVRFDGIVPFLGEKKKEICLTELLKAEAFDSMFMNLSDRETHLRFLFALAASPRYRGTRLNFYVNHSDPVTEKQFSAITFLTDDGTAYVAYRGTDSTFIGWKEDFNMAYLSPVPSQQDAVRYLDTVGRQLSKSKPIRVGGHSKGGNLAVYAATKCSPSVQKRITGIYNHDGPGFKESLFESPAFARIQNRIHTTLPESSLVGLLLRQHKGYVVIKSSNRGIKQHDPFSWIVEDGDFVYAGELKGGAKLRDKTIDQWLETLTDEKRKLFINTLFDVVEASESQTLHEFSQEWHKSATAMLYAIKQIDPETRKFVFQTLTAFAKMSLKNLFRNKDNAAEQDPQSVS